LAMHWKSAKIRISPNLFLLCINLQRKAIHLVRQVRLHHWAIWFLHQMCAAKATA